MNERRSIVWRCHISRVLGLLEIHVLSPDTRSDLLTLSQVQDTIRNGLQYVNEGVFKKVFFWRNTKLPLPTEQELVMMAQFCQPFLADYTELTFKGFADVSVCLALQNMDLSRYSTLKALNISCDGSRQSMTETIAWVQNDSLCSFGKLKLESVRFGREDCRIIGQTISDRRSRLLLLKCSFPSCRDFLTLTAGCVKGEIRRNRRIFSIFDRCVLEDDTIPPLGVLDDNTLDCYSIFAVLWNQYSDVEKVDRFYLWTEKRLYNTAAAFLDYFGRFHEAGLSNLIRIGEQGQQQQRESEPRDWINALAHDAVRDREDLLFHFLTLNPELYATEALNRLGRLV